MKKLTTEERVESKADVLRRLLGGANEPALQRIAHHVIALQDRREGPLVEALRQAYTRLCYLGDVVAAQGCIKALRDYDALDAAPEPTLLEAAKAVVDARTGVFTSVTVDGKAWDALKAAVEREEGKR